MVLLLEELLTLGFLPPLTEADEPEGAPEGYYLAEDGYYYPNDEGYEGQEGREGQEASINEAEYGTQPAYQASAEVEQPTYEQPEATKSEAYVSTTTTRAADDNDNTSTKSDSGGCCGCVVKLRAGTEVGVFAETIMSCFRYEFGRRGGFYLLKAGAFLCTGMTYAVHVESTGLGMCILLASIRERDTCVSCHTYQ